MVDRAKGVKQKDVCKKVHSFSNNINKIWGSTAKRGDYSWQHSIAQFKFATSRT